MGQLKQHHLGVRVDQKLLDRIDRLCAGGIGGLTLSRSDIARRALELGLGFLEGTAQSTPKPTPAHQIATLAKQLEQRTTGLTFVPDVARAWKGQGDVKRVLLAAHRAGLIELRPESGLGRLTQKEIDACPLTQDKTPLSWVRVL